MNELKKEFDLTLIKEGEGEILNKIKEFNCNKEEMTKWIKEKIPKSKSKNEPVGNANEKVMKLFQELEDEYNITSVVDKEEVIAKIIEVNCDRDVMNEWIFQKL